MNKKDTTSGQFTTKKRKKGRKDKRKWKRTKLPTNRIFKEPGFDSSSNDEELVSAENTPSKESKNSWGQTSTPSEIKIRLTPSKSENDTAEAPEEEKSDNEKITLRTLSDNSFEEFFEGNSFCYGDLIDEFADADDDDKGEIVSVSEDVTLAFDSPKKKKKKQTELGFKPNEKLASDDFVSSKPEMQCFHTDDGTVFVMNKSEIIYFYGLFTLSVLHGEIEVLGHTLTKNNQDVNLYSPRGSSLLYLRNTTESNVPVTSYLLNLKVLKRVKFGENCAVILCKKLEEPSISFIEKHMSQQILPKCDNRNLPRVEFQPKGGYNYLRSNNKWNGLIDSINPNTIMMICGGKGVGKTTFLRYAINKLLMKFDEIRVIDLDPGQSEFTVPGCISVVKVSSPLFGCNYSHLKETERSILSNISISYEPKKYIESVRCLLNTPLETTPTLVNYMGFTHGIGLNILSAVIACIQPTDVVQISSQNNKKNYKYVLTPDVIIRNSKIFLPFVSEEIDYNLCQIESMCDRTESGWIAEPRQLREMCILSYLSRIVDYNSVFKAKSQLIRINLSDIKITDPNGKPIHPAAINASLVALCASDKTPNSIFECLGWGVVRGIDINEGYLVLLAEKLELLERVTHLVSNGVTLPPSLYMTPDTITGQMPYVVEGILTSFGQMPKRSRISIKN